MNNTGITILSILVPTISQRYNMFYVLSDILEGQILDLNNKHKMLGNIEFLADDSDTYLNGGLSIGKKRESLVKRAKGKFLCFLDDDDRIAPNYIETLARLCNEDKDIVTFRSFTKTDFYWTIIDMSLNNIANEQATPDSIVKRRPFHICPVKSEYAKLYEFDDINYGEDSKWMEKVLTHCSSEAHTDAVLHQYNHSSLHSEADKITKHYA